MKPVTLFGYPVTITTVATVEINGQQVPVPTTTEAGVNPRGGIALHGSVGDFPYEVSPPNTSVIPTIESKTMIDLDSFLDAVHDREARGPRIASRGTLDELRRIESREVARRKAESLVAEAEALEHKARSLSDKSKAENTLARDKRDEAARIRRNHSL